MSDVNKVILWSERTSRVSLVIFVIKIRWGQGGQGAVGPRQGDGDVRSGPKDAAAQACEDLLQKITLIKIH